MTQTSDFDPQALIETANRLADAAAEVTLKHFRSTSLGTENKEPDDYDPVTIADRGAEEAMRKILAVERPQDGIFGEEFENFEGESGLTWVLDPIDGTRGFVSGTPTWGTLIAVGPESGPILGIVDQPYIGERFIGGLGLAELRYRGTTSPLKTRPACPLAEATIFTTFPEVGTEDEGAAFHRVARQCRLTRYGTDCYAYALLAAGQIDLVIEAGLKAYDIQGPLAVIEAAGGKVTNWEGGPVHMGGRVIAAANAEIYDEAMELLQGTA